MNKGDELFDCHGIDMHRDDRLIVIGVAQPARLAGIDAGQLVGDARHRGRRAQALVQLRVVAAGQRQRFCASAGIGDVSQVRQANGQVMLAGNGAITYPLQPRISDCYRSTGGNHKENEKSGVLESHECSCH